MGMLRTETQATILGFMRLRHDRSLRHRLIISISAMFIPLTLASGALILFRNTMSDFYGQDNIVREEFFALSNLEDQLVAALIELEQPEPTIDSPAQKDFQTRIGVINQIFVETKTLNSHLSEKGRLIKASESEWRQAQLTRDFMFNTALTTAKQEQAHVDSQFHLRQAIQHTRTLQAKLQVWLLDDNQKRAEHLERTIWLITLLLILLAFGILMSLIVMLSRWVFKPLTQLETGVLKFGLGELDHRITLKNSEDELGQLAKAFNVMAEELSRSQNNLKKLATLDGLTGVHNRREFDLWLTIETERASRDQQPVSLVMVDLDHFKNLNDTYGHQAGDEALRSVAQLLCSTVRPGDLVTRYGGEEFAIILPKTENGIALAIAERIRQAIADTPIDIQSEPPILTDDCPASSDAIALAERIHKVIAEQPAPLITLRVTASLGLASFPMDAQSKELLLVAADQALYYAKENGRNQVGQASSVIASRPMPPATDFSNFSVDKAQNSRQN